jgi:hypothetical protein
VLLQKTPDYAHLLLQSFEYVSSIESKCKAARTGISFCPVLSNMDFDCFLEIDGKHRIMNCRKYQYAIVPSHLATHLKVHHPRLTLQQRCNHISKTERCSTLAKIHEEVVYPASDDPPIPSLPIYFDGLKSDWISDRRNACSYVCRDLRLMRKHCKAET